MDIEELRKIGRAQHKALVDKWYDLIINSHDINQALKTHENKQNQLREAEEITFKIFVKINNFYNHHFLPSKRGTLTSLQIMLEVQTDLKTSIHLAEYCYYKPAIGTLRTALEQFFRLVYFTQFPQEYDKFGIDDNYCSIAIKKILKLKFKKLNIVTDILDYFRDTSSYVHSDIKTFSKKFHGITVYNEKKFNEWFDYLNKLSDLVKKICDDF